MIVAAQLRALALIALAFLLNAQERPVQEHTTSAITAETLRTHVKYLASDRLEGRNTPSRGLDLAADYIASEFRRAGLETLPDGGYFQTAPFVQAVNSAEPPLFSLSGADPISSNRIEVRTTRTLHLTGAPVFKWVPGTKIDASLAGAVLILRAPSDPALTGKLAFSGPAAIVKLVRGFAEETLPPAARLTPDDEKTAEAPAILSVPAVDVEAVFDRLPAGMTGARASLTVTAPAMKKVALRNVAGILPGSDPALCHQYLLISAHYDHLGMSETGAIYSGANDDASGVATVIELARALSRENPHPRRTLVFVCFFGEERGLLGSRWYIEHPLVPLAETVADINLEQLGEPAPRQGFPESALAATGFSYSDIPPGIAPDLKAGGVTLREVRHNREFFERGDNLAFAQAGIPAHTLVAALDYPDYHRVTDKWEKLDYSNMAKLDRALAVALLNLANRDAVPHWNAGNKNTSDFRSAWRDLHP